MELTSSKKRDDVFFVKQRLPCPTGEAPRHDLACSCRPWVSFSAKGQQSEQTGEGCDARWGNRITGVRQGKAVPGCQGVGAARVSKLVAGPSKEAGARVETS